MKKWILKNKKADLDTLSQTLGYSKPFCNLLVNRGWSDETAIRGFLHPSSEVLHPTVAMKGLDDGVSMIMDHIQAGRNIRVIGDYDVDGVSSTYLLVRAIRICGGKVDYAIPDRVTDGYGINTDMVARCVEAGVELIVTCDNGISAHDAIAYAKDRGLATIVTDHHQVELLNGHMVLPAADVIINPKQTDCPYPFKGLCGAGVAYKVVSRLFERMDYSLEDHPDFSAITALATVCDVVDLIDENRYLVQIGLGLMTRCNNPGLSALLQVHGLNGTAISSYHLGYVLGPCLNAAGRLTHAKAALALLFEEDEGQARKLAEELRSLNEERKDQTKEGVRRVLEQVDAQHANDRVLVVYDAQIHESIAGIVAGRVREAKYRPTIVLTEGENGVKGSGRSIEAYDMFEALSDFRSLYQGFGGHPMAIGLSLVAENVALLREGLNQRFALPDEALLPVVSLDLNLPLRFATGSFVEELQLMEPFGKANPVPMFVDKAVVFTGAKIVGKHANVLLLSIRDDRGEAFKGVLFQYDPAFDRYMDEKFGPGTMNALTGPKESSYSMDIVYQPQINEFQDRRSIQLVIKEYR